MENNPMYVSIMANIAELRQSALKSDKPYVPTPERLWDGIKTPVLRKMMRANKKAWLVVGLEERLETVRLLFESHNGEQSEIATYILHISLPELRVEHLENLDHYADHFQGWGTVDDFCINVLQPFFLKFQPETIAMLRQWNQSPNPWKRRSSMVVFVRKIGLTGEYTDLCLAFAENLIHDRHDLVQKGVGWALKDVMRGDKEPVMAYVKDLRRRGITSVITLYAIRDIKGDERKEILAIKAG